MNLLSLFETKVYAASVGTDPLTGISITSVSGLVTMITNIVIIVGLALVVLFLAIGFVKYVSSGGDKNAVDSAQKTLTYAVIGGVGLLLVYGIRALILTLLGGDDSFVTNY
ncbi:MAG: hypothetical protein UU64_C0004G0054 [candidate division WWE3 bacterium GW2011_GWF2_41_45]|uniref:Integral membrane protein n=3 Tax=Katanobacteria TaxID=422282 RepID=A0A1F4W0S7_UNCKA|nr:MAG: hypothetical protein UU55_C0007G0040 [candidate division WWE3 bacterium GW2011_GWC2_41_23]KKS10457.1 MAG: hypothetical protein UU64_C0004G0054 [candidate division WWE3 bacterium GW2011_GWF2_41_45]KKS19759.1 MAG: hypothetical protein UU79_C0010G0004 [candidate division WWE3 bacterium GW2011_GWE1_41_72]KKS26319.1 MAG: hypothetical protein UU86_C0041G0007 [candidate division WWE3 bacterium GW2011_GWC1_42_102]KKS29941.1 MAG: hypothetical protein UU90_C0006G0006 [candidate division WWE3 bact